MLSLCGGSGATSMRAAQAKKTRFAKSSRRNVARKLKFVSRPAPNGSAQPLETPASTSLAGFYQVHG